MHEKLPCGITTKRETNNNMSFSGFGTPFGGQSTTASKPAFGFGTTATASTGESIIIVFLMTRFHVEIHVCRTKSNCLYHTMQLQACLLFFLFNLLDFLARLGSDHDQIMILAYPKLLPWFDLELEFDPSIL